MGITGQTPPPAWGGRFAVGVLAAGIGCICAVMLAYVGFGVSGTMSDGAHPAAWVAGIALIAVLCMAAAWYSVVRQRTALRTLRDYLVALAEGKLDASPDSRAHEASIAPLTASVTALATAYLMEMGLKKGIIEGLPTPFLLVDTKERALYTNQECLDMLEIDGDPKSQHGRTLAEIFYNDSSRQTAVGQSIANGKVFSNLEVTITGHRGGVRHVLANVYPLYDMGGTCVGGFCLYLDMTVLKQKEEQICAHSDMVARAASRAMDISNGLASAAEELSAQVEQSSTTSRQQLDNTREVSLSMEQMNATVIDVAKNASEAASLADSAKAKAKEGAAVVGESRRLTERVQQDALALRDDMNALGQQAESIGAVVGVINDIADQTNLLALNAAIEAARAGEYGRGFAVVADEVRKLAEKTMQATKEVTEAIASIQQSTKRSVDSSENAAKAIGENTRLAADSGKTLDEIVLMVEQTADHVREIAAASEQQSAAGDEIVTATESITHSAEENAHAMHESAIAVGELAQMAAELKALIEEMRAEAPESCEAEE